MFYATDTFKFPNNKVHHVLYKLKGDPDCPYINLRIIHEKSDFAT
jgi:hypothetical protein